MVLIPAGVFQMGCGTADTLCDDDESPLREVYLDEYYIDRYEVTNTKYAACVAEGDCAAPQATSSATRSDYYDNPEFANYPVINIDWSRASQYCAWEGKRLPTEAEWEKAARGSSDSRAFPWGDSEPNDILSNFAGNVGDTSEVGSYPEGASPYGVMDMAGNVLEETNDWYAAGYYATAPDENPNGPSDGVFRSLRGGAWCSAASDTRSSARSISCDLPWTSYVGFRCVASVN
jgi:formylglycine-generating enzyme required for sulfatase activity